VSFGIISDQTLNVASRGLQGLWKKQQLTANNLANIDTPGYKAERFDFDGYMAEALQNPSTQADNSFTKKTDRTSSRIDGNNVDIDSEMVLMTKNAARYQSVMAQVGRRVNLLNSVIRDS